MVVTKENITSVIPQRAPFIMIDEVVKVDERYTKSSFRVTADNIFLQDGELAEAGLVENIAQTAAARAGYLALTHKLPVAIGYIGSVSRLEINGLPRQGNLLETRIEVTNQVFNATIITGEIMCNGQPLAKCEMKIFINNNSTES
jgi:predicted hotdog family 3-hydroxylacyl-ACP dehydratase